MDYYSTACYKDILQIDGAFAEAHLFYHKTPVFDGVNATSIVEGLDENRIINEIDSKSTRNNFDRFRGTFEEYNVSERLELWKRYFKEYANAFNKFCSVFDPFSSMLTNLLTLTLYNYLL